MADWAQDEAEDMVGEWISVCGLEEWRSEHTDLAAIIAAALRAARAQGREEGAGVADEMRRERAHDWSDAAIHMSQALAECAEAIRALKG